MNSEFTCCLFSSFQNVICLNASSIGSFYVCNDSCARGSDINHFIAKGEFE